ncbi:MAG: phosphoserine phosphatase SerB [Bdellovibrionales bacterium]|nr:phosphoserine phosphatase SerB [Bdellovibrionales bacterium]
MSEPSAGKEAMRTTFSTALDARQFYSKLKLDPPGVAIHAASIVSSQAKKTPKKLFVFDMDSTFINQEVIDEIGREIGVYDRFAEITEEAMKGQIDFVQAFYDRIAMLKGVPVESAYNILPRITLSPGIETFLEWIRSTGAQTMIVSGGFQFVLEHLQKSTGVDCIHGHTLETDSSGVFTGKLAGSIIDGERKRKLVQEKIRELGVTADEVVIVGDGANDIKMMAEASTRVAFQGKEKLNLETNTWILDRHYRWLKALL